MSDSREWDILGVGDADVDLFLRVGRLPRRDEKVLGEYLGEYPGGIVANYCCAASRLGSRTALASVVGDDRYGEMAIAGLRQFGVNTNPVRVRAGGQTYFCVVMLDESGEKALTVVKTDCIFPALDDIDAELFSRTRLVHTMGDNVPVASWAAREAKARGALVSLDVEPTTAGSGLHDLEGLLANVDLVFPNGAGLASLMDGDLLGAARRILAMGPRVVVVTLGAKGCLIVTEGEPVQLPAFRAPVVDTTGAGDCFNAAFVTGYLKEWDLVRCGRFASAAAALSVTRVGSRSALPTPDEVERFLSEQPAE